MNELYYHGIRGMKYSGYNAKNPLIFIDNSAVKVNSVNRIQENLLAKGTAELAKAYYEIKGKAFVEKLLWLVLLVYPVLLWLPIGLIRIKNNRDDWSRSKERNGRRGEIFVWSI